MEQFPTNNPENTNQDIKTSGSEEVGFEPFDKEKAQQLRDEYYQKHSEEDHQKESLEGRYQTLKEVRDALKSVEGQLYWGKTLGALIDAVSISDATEIVSGGDPKWKALFTSSDIYPPREGSYTVEAVVNDEYNELAQNGSEKIASSGNKKFLIKPDYGYTETYFVGQKPIDINGFNRMSQDGEFPEETDFTVENKTENHNIPNRINEILYELFGKNELSTEEKDMLNDGGDYFGYLDYVEYPDENTLKNVHEELETIIDGIGNIDELENKRHLLETKVHDFESR